MSDVNVKSPATPGSTQTSTLQRFLADALTLGMMPVVLAGALVGGTVVSLEGVQYVGAVMSPENGQISMAHSPSPLEKIGALHRKAIDDTIENISVSVQTNLQSMIPSVSIEKLEPGMPSPKTLDQMQRDVAHRREMMQEAIQQLNKIDLEIKTQENFPSKEQVRDLNEAIGNFNGQITRDHQHSQDYNTQPMTKYMKTL